MDKYNLSDSEDSELDEQKKESLQKSSRKRSGSFTRLEEEIYKKMQQKKQKQIDLLRKHKIKLDNDMSSNGIISNFSKMHK